MVKIRYSFPNINPLLHERGSGEIEVCVDSFAEAIGYVDRYIFQKSGWELIEFHYTRVK